MCQPHEPDKFSVDELMKKLDVAYTRFTFKITEWANFFVTKQREGQSLVQFANDLRDKTVNCSFPSTILDDLLSAVFVAGVTSDMTRRHLMSQELRSFDEALNVARRFETGQQEAKRNGPRLVPEEVNKVTQRKSGQSASNGNEECSRCGRTSHSTTDCPFIDRKCYGCGKKGHAQSMCWSEKKDRESDQNLKKVGTIFNQGKFYDIL
jgi:hypothetical protein